MIVQRTVHTPAQKELGDKFSLYHPVLLKRRQNSCDAFETQVPVALCAQAEVVADNRVLHFPPIKKAWVLLLTHLGNSAEAAGFPGLSDVCLSPPGNQGHLFSWR